MLSIYRRHLKACEHRAEGRGYRRCRCPIWVDGFLDERDIRQSLKTRDWQKAQDMVRGWEADAAIPMTAQDSEPVTIEKAMTEYLADAQARRLKTSTIDRHRILFRQLEQFAQKEGLRYIKQLDTPTLRRFRASWKDGNISGLKKLERLRTFFKFVRENGWLPDNPASPLKNPVVRLVPTLPFSQDEMIKILTTAQKNVDEARADSRNKKRRVRALALLLRYSGLRISDAVGCSVDRIEAGKLFLYTAKTGQQVYVPLPEFVVKELEICPKLSERYWFWTGSGTIETARKKWSEALSDLFSDAEVNDGHAHRFRDTFAVELLLNGTPIENVAAFLGHASTRITQKHYSAWVRARQEQAEADVKRSWERDPVVLMQTKGTSEVHGASERPN